MVGLTIYVFLVSPLPSRAFRVVRRLCVRLREESLQ